MILSMRGQAGLFILTVGIGFIIGFVYDMFRVIRKQIKHSNWLIQLEDIIYWILVSIVMFYFMLNKNYGEIRLFSIAGAIIGMIIYFLSLSGLVIKVFMTIISFIRQVAVATLRLILFPVKLVLRLLSYPFKMLAKALMKTTVPAKKLLRKSSRYAKMKGNHLFKELKVIFKKV